jgi:predicted hotdog family 3-hydroxylacyl-ACP dehydratase
MPNVTPPIPTRPLHAPQGPALKTDSLPRERSAIAALIPHQDAMCLLECVEYCDSELIVCSTRSHAAPANPLRSSARAGGHLAAVHLCEYGAQAMAVHGGLLARQAGAQAEPGLLVSLRDVKFSVAQIDAPEALEVRARRLHGSEAGWQYDFEVRAGERVLAAGRAMVMKR